MTEQKKEFISGPDGEPLVFYLTDKAAGKKYVALAGGGKLLWWPEEHMAPYGYLEKSLAGAAIWNLFNAVLYNEKEIKKAIQFRGQWGAELEVFEWAIAAAEAYGVDLAHMLETQNVCRADAEAARIGLKLSPELIAFITFATREKERKNADT